MYELRIPTCVFGLKVEKTSKAEALHLPRRKNIIPVEKRASLGHIWAISRMLHSEVLGKWPQFRISFKFHDLEQLLVVIFEEGPLKQYFLFRFFFGISLTNSSPLLHPAHPSSSAD